jgi:hypothetical protein
MPHTSNVASSRLWQKSNFIFQTRKTRGMKCNIPMRSPMKPSFSMLFRSNVLLLGLGHFQSHTCLVSRADLGVFTFLLTTFLGVSSSCFISFHFIELYTLLESQRSIDLMVLGRFEFGCILFAVFSRLMQMQYMLSSRGRDMFNGLLDLI